ncbi:TolB family protein [Flagellimonas sp.]|uniref:TolB family protein n=1 Tax=Flagellimonas sp. TaxID=2058762 RepID=UPI003B5A4FC7
MDLKKHLLFLTVLGLLACHTKNEADHAGESIKINLEKSPNELEIFANGLISTGLHERDLAITPDKNELYYTLGSHNDAKRAIIKVSKSNADWNSQNIASFSGIYNDIEPFISPDGSKFFFCSDRPMDADSTRTDYNIWVMDKTENGWGEPNPLGENINTPGNEFYPSVSKNGNLYFTAIKPEGPGTEDIYVSAFENGSYANPVPLDTTVNSKTYEFNAFISPNEDILVFSSYGRDDGLGGGDLYMSVLDSLGNWGKAKNLGPTVNSTGLDFCPFIDFENNNFYFSSNRVGVENTTDFKTFKDALSNPKNGSGDIYRISLKKLMDLD